MSTIASTALTARYELKVVKAFRAHNALSGPTARRLQDLGLKDTDHLRQMVVATILRKAGPERFFLHEATWAARGHMSWRTVGWIAAAGGLLFAAGVIYVLVR